MLGLLKLVTYTSLASARKKGIFFDITNVDKVAVVSSFFFK